MTVNSSEVWGSAFAAELDKREGLAPEDLLAENQRLRAANERLQDRIGELLKDRDNWRYRAEVGAGTKE